MHTMAYAEEARYVRRVGHLSDREIAQVTGAGLSAWLRMTRSPSGQRAQRLVELSAMVERLAKSARG
ncbi:MAG: hypothetical protein ACYCUD_10575 [Candidatus Dormibacteria bacterium]